MSDNSDASATNHPISWSSYIELQLVWPQWLIPGLIPTGSSVCLYGKRGLGKTFLALDWGLCIATGTPWNGLSVKQGRVAYLLAERPEGLKRRIQGWLKHRGVPERKLERNFIAARSTHALNDKKSLKEVIQALNKDSEENGPFSLVIFDPLISFMKGFENDSRDMQEFIHGIREIVGEDNNVSSSDDRQPHALRSVLVVHHEGKSRGPFFKGARGSSALEAGIDTVLHLKGNFDEASIDTTKQREQTASGPVGIAFVPVTDDKSRNLGMYPKPREIKNAREKSAKTKSNEEKQQDILRSILKDASEDNPFDIDRIVIEAQRAEFNSFNVGLGKSSLQNAISRMCGDGGEIEQIDAPLNDTASKKPGKRKKAYFLTPNHHLTEATENHDL